MARINNLTGKRFGKLVAHKCVDQDQFNNCRWLCRCDCGQEIENGCFMCGDKRHQCLEFHHKNPATKLFAIGQGLRESKKRIEAEINKCQVVCANCHRCLHFDSVNSLGENIDGNQ